MRGTFGSDCEWTCSACANGATCNLKQDGCDCESGWTGLLCNETCTEVVVISYSVSNVRLSICIGSHRIISQRVQSTIAEL